MSLFDADEQKHLGRAQPLAARMRPRNLDEFVGQRHFLGDGKLLRRLIDADRLGSLIFYGPPGTGKTTLARLLAAEGKSHFQPVSAISSNVKELRELMAAAQRHLRAAGERTLLFVDEIHRFNRSQQDVLLGDVEDGVVILIGATTQNPFFSINSALISRSRVFEFRPLSVEEVRALLERALSDEERGLGRYRVDAADDALTFLAEVTDGDARAALSALEIGVLSAAGSGSPGAAADASGSPVLRFGMELARESVQRKAVDYDRLGDRHYDAASALIKSIRGSDPDAALYWLAYMLEGGEDVRFVTRRLIILASEDIGNADPGALTLAVSAMQACEFIGLPECQLTLAQTVTYLACAPKSNAATVAIAEARADISGGRIVPVPTHLRGRGYSGARRLGHGEGYRYAHEGADGVVEQEYLGVERNYYRPTDRGYESELTARLETLRARVRGNRKKAE